MTDPFADFNAGIQAAREDYTHHPIGAWSYNAICRCRRCDARRSGWRAIKAKRRSEKA